MEAGGVESGGVASPRLPDQQTIRNYVTPDAYDQPDERGITWARNPQMTMQRKQQQPGMERKAP